MKNHVEKNKNRAFFAFFTSVFGKTRAFLKTLILQDESFSPDLRAISTVLLFSAYLPSY